MRLSFQGSFRLVISAILELAKMNEPFVFWQLSKLWSRAVVAVKVFFQSTLQGGKSIVEGLYRLSISSVRLRTSVSETGTQKAIKIDVVS
ncbi:hypothetical protein [Martelella mediterranea]|uniref:hypothetical protein n=1 Tax=Martelella mediterranea TaxID=293089 RepID=UPI001053813D|nr:hypothetical protein [Martelella mediterranea]